MRYVVSRIIIFLLGIALSSSAIAEQYLMGLTLSPTWASGRQSQTLLLQSNVEKTYTANNGGSAFPTVQLFLGVQRPIPQQSLLGQLGLDFVMAGNAKLRGDIWEDANPAFNNFNYSYKLMHTHVALKGRLIAYPCECLQPYMSASIGVGLNRSYDFAISPTVPGEVAPPAFGSDNQYAFVYSIGIGLQKVINPQLLVAIGYEFADWGKNQLSTAPGQTTNQRLSYNHLYAQQLQFSLFYLF